MSDLDITKNIKNIEKLKCELLSGVADLFESMRMPSWHGEERAEILADVIIKAYILAKRTGIDYEALDSVITKQLRLAVLEEGKAACDSGLLLRRMERDHV